ncbi:flagellar hook assembly protein FlgD [Chitinimonas sp. JJ19]|uniref:flagellar hook assembly protein FlgD n=1 Tax=Chitinimonas sp. JJ19 TaxID=3109352 RepID=UPI001A5F7D24|nr:flagellar hook assembly protein FlgD [Chitinimonas sp.]
MTTTTGVTNSADLFESINKARDSKNKSQETQDRFLKLLITQLQNQDPMNPMDSAESTSQMAQMSTVSGIENMNASITSMMATFNAAQSYQAAALIGKTVMVEGDTMQFDGSKPVTNEIDVPAEGGVVTVAIYDASNNKVDEIQLGKQLAGRQAVEWDGKGANGNSLPAGKYYISASVAQANGGNKQIPSYTYVKVDSVAMTGGTVNLRLTDGRVLPFGDVSSIM